MKQGYDGFLYVPCPECNHVNKLNVRTWGEAQAMGGGPGLVTCDIDDGGCDKCFVVKIKKRVEWDVGTARVGAMLPVTDPLEAPQEPSGAFNEAGSTPS